MAIDCHRRLQGRSRLFPPAPSLWHGIGSGGEAGFGSLPSPNPAGGVRRSVPPRYRAARKSSTRCVRRAEAFASYEGRELSAK